MHCADEPCACLLARSHVQLPSDDRRRRAGPRLRFPPRLGLLRQLVCGVCRHGPAAGPEQRLHAGREGRQGDAVVPRDGQPDPAIGGRAALMMLDLDESFASNQPNPVAYRTRLQFLASELLLCLGSVPPHRIHQLVAHPNTRAVFADELQQMPRRPRPLASTVGRRRV